MLLITHPANHLPTQLAQFDASVPQLHFHIVFITVNATVTDIPGNCVAQWGSDSTLALRCAAGPSPLAQ